MFEVDFQTKGIVVEPSVDDLIAARRLADDIVTRTTDDEIRTKARRIRKLIDCSLDKISTLSQTSHVLWENSKDHALVAAESVRVWQL